jgi:hypothetical protein
MQDRTSANSKKFSCNAKSQPAPQGTPVADVRYWSKTGKPGKWTVELSIQRLL